MAFAADLLPFTTEAVAALPYVQLEMHHLSGLLAPPSAV